MRSISTTKYWDGEPMRRAKNPDKETILAFLKGRPYVAVAAGRFADHLTGETVRSDWLAYEAGEYSWDSCDIYHFERYDLELDPAFCEHVLRSDRERGGDPQWP